jgi:hypothetical protein
MNPSCTGILAHSDIADMVGWTLIARKTIVGRIDKGERKDDFQGCDWGRIIVFDDNTGVRCTGYGCIPTDRPPTCGPTGVQ